MNKSIILLVGFSIFTSCGIKGPPLPPIQEETLQMQKVGDDVEKITTPPPERKTKKTTPKKKAKPNEN